MFGQIMHLGLKNFPNPWAHVLHRLKKGKPDKFFLSETARPTALIFGM